MSFLETYTFHKGSGNRGSKPITFEQFEQKYLIENFCNKNGKPKHTRLVKEYFYKFTKQLKEKYGFDIHTCSHCGLTEWNGLAIIMELDHINSIINDSRISNLRPLCPNCHSQTPGYKNRKHSVCEHVAKLKSITND